MAYFPKVAMRSQVAQELRTIFNAADREEAEHRLKLMVERHRKSAPKLAQSLGANVAEGLTVFAFDPSHQRRLQTTNGPERRHQQIKRRTRVATLFPSEASLLRLITASLAEFDDEGSTGRQYLNTETC